jgi:hypothetical protein
LLIAGSSEEPIMHYILKKASLVDNPVYTALSYTWGNLTLTKPIIIDGTTFQVTENLAVALRHLKREDRTEGLWVDAVYINQSDTTEKNEQLPLIGSIYQNATEVVVWLGPATKDGDNRACSSDILVDLLSELGEQACELLELAPSGVLKLPESRTDERLLKLKQTFNRFMERTGPLPLIEAYKSFAARQWWRRVWVAQELALATKPIFAIGDKRLLYDHLNAAMEFWAYIAMETV